MIGDKEKDIIYIGSDHAGYKEKESLREYLKTQGYQLIDLGCFNEDSCDYPDIADEVGEKVSETQGARGILFCGTGIGMSIAANKLKGVRAALCNDEAAAEMARRHNDANVITMGARVTGMEEQKKIATKFLTTEFEGSKKGGERHLRRVKKMTELENKRK